MALKAVELIVSGEVQGVGYRGFVTRIARKLQLVGFAENVEDGTVRIHCKGEAAAIDKFKALINVKNPPLAPLIEVEGITEKALGSESVTGTGFKEKLGELGDELSQGFATGNAYLNAGFNSLSTELKQFRTESNTNFQELSVKYGKISTTMDHIDKNIEKIATKKKGIFD